MLFFWNLTEKIRNRNAFVQDENFDKLALWYALPILLITSDSFCAARNWPLYPPSGPEMVDFVLTHKTFLWFNAHLNRTNHKGKYLTLKYYKKIVLYMHRI